MTELTFIPPESDYMTYMEKGIPTKTLCSIRNANIYTRMTRWKGCLPGTFHKGCAINSLVFIGEMSTKRGCEESIKVLKTNGTPFQNIIDWFDVKFNKSDVNKKYKEVIYPLNQILELFMNELPLDSCTIVKLNRNPENARIHNLCTGHTIVIGKDVNNQIWFIDPQKMKFQEWNNKDIMNDFKIQMYENISVVNLNDNYL